MSLGSIRISSEVGRGAAAPSVANRLNVRMPHLESGRPFDGAGSSGKAYQQLAYHIQRRHERQVDEVSAETAQKVQSAMSDSSIKLYGRKEMDADGVVEAWDAECQKAIKEAGANLDPDTRKAFERRMAPWMAGRRENLMEHQYREVRRGRVNALENDMRTTATAETNDILALTSSEQEDWKARLASGTKPEDIASERDKAFDTHFQQMMAVQQATETRYADAAAQGLYGTEEAKSRCVKARHDAAKTLLDAAVGSGNADFAEYILNRIGSSQYGKRNDGKTYKGTGWLGELRTANGDVATEYSVGVNIDGREQDIPTLVPTLSNDEIDTMLNDIIPNGKKIPHAIMQKAVDHAKKMQKEGKSAFANDGVAIAAKCGLSADELTGYRSAVQGIRKRKASEAAAAAHTAEKDAVYGDVDTFNKTVVDALDPYFVPTFSKEEKLAELSRDTRLSPAARQQRMHQWASWFDAREADAIERTNHAAKSAEKAAKDLQEDRAKNGYEMPLANGKSVWVSATRWGQTQADLYHWFTTDAIARDPVMAISRAEALKATGSISKEDYTHTISTATAFQSPKIVEAANRALGGNLFSLVDTANPKKGTTTGADFAADLAYKYDPTAKTGFTGSFQTRGFFGSARPSSLTADMRQLDKTGEKLFTPEEKTALFKEIGWMVSRGYTPEQIDASVQRIVAPKMQLFYNMTMQERLANQTFLRQLRENVTSFDDTVSAIVSKNTDKPISKVKNAP